MTKKAQEAYMRGFCKVAEAYGVDPHELYKYAGMPLKQQAGAAALMAQAFGKLAPGMSARTAQNIMHFGLRSGMPYESIMKLLNSRGRVMFKNPIQTTVRPSMLRRSVGHVPSVKIPEIPTLTLAEAAALQ